MTSAFITLLTSESYLPGVLTLGKVLKEQHQTPNKLAILVSTSAISADALDLIKSIYDDVIDVKDSLIYSSVEDVKKLLGRPELAVTYSKVLLWNLTQYSKLVYLDADTLPIQPLDHLFENEPIEAHQVSASPDAGWPDIFNSGVLVLKPSAATFQGLLDHIDAAEGDLPPSFDGADQGLLNEYFNIKSSGSNWRRLPFIYNVTPNASYQYTPAFERFASDIKLIHFIGAVKPWNADELLHGNFQSQASSYDVHKLWWKTFHEHFPGELGAKILKQKGEGHALKFEKATNTWDQDSASGAVGGKDFGGSAAPLSPVFPWEHREEARAPTRTFTPPPAGDDEAHHETLSEKITHDLKKSIETLQIKSGLGASSASGSHKTGSLKDKYNIDQSEENKWDPAASLNEIAKLPSKLLSKKREEDEKKK